MREGTLLGDRYELRRRVGHGGHGQVWQAFDRRHRRPVAVKLRRFSAPEELEVLFEEARTLLGLPPDERLPVAREDFVVGDCYVIVTDWVDGENLGQVVESEGSPGLPLRTALDYLSQAAVALDQVHGRTPPVVHGDVKPANLIRTPEGRIVLVDFGLGSNPTEGAGTPGYRPPEAKDEPPGPAGDVFGLAATAYTLLTGLPPSFGARPRISGLEGAEAERVERALLDGLALDPSRRPPTARAFVELLSPGTSTPNNLPAALSSFIGRGGDLDRLGRALRSARMITLTGPPGVGKSRLAAELARRSLGRFPDGVRLAELAGLTHDELVAEQAAAAVGVEGAVEDLAAELEGKDALLVLDDCEHVLDGCAALADTLLRRCPSLRIVATSREPVRVEGEVLHPVEPLPVPQAEETPDPAAFDAVRLFSDRARASDPAFDLTPDAAPSVVRICRRLDGLPLAIELAASRTRAVPVSEIARGLEDRFALLDEGLRTAPPRHRSLVAALEWSARLLPDVERRLLARLGVFAGSFTAEAAALVCGGDGIEAGAVEGLLARMEERSLLALDTRAGRRFRMLESVREYGRRLLGEGELDRLRHRCASWAARLAEDLAKDLFGPRQAEGLARLEADHDNLRAALAWALDADIDLARRLAGALADFWLVRGYWAEGQHFLDALAGRLEAGAARAAVLRHAGRLATEQGKAEGAREVLEESLGIERDRGDRGAVADCLNHLGILAERTGAYEEAARLHGEVLELCRRGEDAPRLAQAHQNLGVVAWDRGDVAAAKAHYEAALELHERAGDLRGAAQTLLNLGNVAAAEGDLSSARRRYGESLGAHERLGDEKGVASCLNNLGGVAAYQRDTEAAREAFDRCLATCRRLGDLRTAAAASSNLGEVARADGELRRAREHYEEARALSRSAGDGRGVAQALDGLAALARDEGDLDRALRLGRDALRLHREIDDDLGLPGCLELLADLAALRGEAERGAELLGAADAARARIGLARPPLEEDAYRRTLDRLRSALGEERSRELIERGRGLTGAEAAEHALDG